MLYSLRAGPHRHRRAAALATGLALVLTACDGVIPTGSPSGAIPDAHLVGGPIHIIDPSNPGQLPSSPTISDTTSFPNTSSTVEVPTSGSPPTTTAPDTAVTSTPPTTPDIPTTQPTTTTAPPTSTTAQPTTTTARPSSTTKPPSGQLTTGDVIDPNAASVFFFSDNDDCRGIENQQRHPDWQQGQRNSDLNADGTPTYGFAYNTGDATKGEISWGFEQAEISLSGDCVLAMSLSDAYESRRAVRIFRRYDRNGSALPSEAYYSAWYYFPVDLAFDSRATIDGQTRYGYWNVFQIKNKVNGQSLADLSVNAGKVTGDNAMSFSIWRKSECGAVEECSRAATITPHTNVPIPVGRWVHFELYLKASTGSDGRVVAWQDGQEIIDFSGQTERAGTERRAWSVNNYGQLHRPADHTLYVDDVLISTQPVHTKLFG